MKRPLIGLTIIIIALALTACGGGGGGNGAATTTTRGSALAGDAVKGAELYVGSCMACHGPDGTGIEGLGKSWAGSTFIQSTTDADLLAFLYVGRPASDPLNTTGVDMPPKGGNPSLKDQDLLDLIAYMRTLNP